MNEDVIFKRRNRLKKHFVNTSLVLLYCYNTVSDAAKITFQVIDAFDWESKETGDSKGFVFPAVATLAKIRQMSIRTIQRHISELIHAKLLTRIRRKYKPSILLIEEVTEAEAQKYFAVIDGHSHTRENLLLHPQEMRNDKTVASPKASETTKLSFAFRKEHKGLKENEINVNENFKRTHTGLDVVGNILARYDLHSNGRPNGKARTHAPKAKPNERVKRDYFAQEMAAALQDHGSLGCYRVIAEKVPPEVIYQTLGLVKEAWQEGKVRQSRGALFVDIIKTYCHKHAIHLDFHQSPSREKDSVGKAKGERGEPIV